VTASEEEWAEAILALDQIVIEGFKDKPLRHLASQMGIKLEKEWRSLKLLDECLKGKGRAESDVDDAIQALRTVRDLRTIVKGHFAPAKKVDAIRQALSSHGSFQSHFKSLCAGCDEALELVLDTFRITAGR
jgi:hypothetical protein